MADLTDDEIIDALYPQKVLNPAYKKRKESEIAKAITPTETPEETYTRTAKETFEGAKETAGKFVEEAKEKYFPSEEQKRKELEEAVKIQNAKDRLKGPEEEIALVDLNKEVLGDKKAYANAVANYEGKQKEITDAKWRKVGSAINPVNWVTGAKEGLSETKLKLEASRYGVTGEQFEKYKEGKIIKGYNKKGDPVYGGSLTDVKYMVDMAKSREQGLKHAKELDEKTKAEAAATRAQAAQRYAKAEQVEATVPQGGRKLVKFGWKEGSFGQEPTYVNAAGTHGQIRSQFLPGKATGVSNSLQNSRLEIAKMKQRVLGGMGSSGSSTVRLLTPGQNAGMPNVVQRLNPNKSSYGGGFGGPSVLQKLGFRGRRYPPRLPPR